MSESSCSLLGDAEARTILSQNFQVLAIRGFELLRRGERVFDFQRAIPFRLRLDDDAVAEDVAGDARDDAALTAVETLGYAEDDAEFAHGVHVLDGEHILIAHEILFDDLVLSVSRRHERREHEVLVRHAVEVAVEDDVAGMLLVVIVFDSHTRVVHKRGDFESAHVHTGHFVQHLELLEKLN